MVTKIISGAQTGADRAGLDAALALGLEVGGWLPLGKRTDDGPLSLEDFSRYKLREHPSSGYPGRTEQNVREADGTVIFGNPYSPGCSLTLRLCEKHHKEWLIMEDKDVAYSPRELRKWLDAQGVKVLNVAGNRERKSPGIYKLTYNVLLEALNNG